MQPITKESQVAASLKKAVKLARGMILKVPLTNIGLPDYLVHLNGVTFYVETKMTTQEVQLWFDIKAQ